MATRAEFTVDRDLIRSLETALRVPPAVAVVGAGRWAKVVCNVLAAFRPAISKIVLVAERNHADASTWVDEQIAKGSDAHRRVSVTPSLQDVLDANDIEAAIVTKMASEHYAAARRLLQAGKHVLVEKPLVLHAVEARELVDVARTKRRVLAVGYEFMFDIAFQQLRELAAEHLTDVRRVRFVWSDSASIMKWGVLKRPDFSANAITDLCPHLLSVLSTLFGDRDIEVRRVSSRSGWSDAELELACGSIDVRAALDKNAASPRRTIEISAASGRSLTLDFSAEPPRFALDGRELSVPSAADRPPSLSTELTYFFARLCRSDVALPNEAGRTIDFVDVTERANEQLQAIQARELKQWLWRDLPNETPETARHILRHQLLNQLLAQQLVTNPKDTEALDAWADRAFRIVHRFSRDPWAQQADILSRERLAPPQLAGLNAALRDSAFVQRLMIHDGVARQYWSTILPLVETGSIDAVLSNRYQFPLRVGIYAAVWCMFSCTFCGRMENPDARYAARDVEPGNQLFDEVFAAMPRGVSTLSLGGGLEPLTNPRLDDVIRSAKRHGHKVPLVTNGYMLTPLHVKRHPALWDVDVLRISLYGADEAAYQAVTKKRGAFQIVKDNLIEFLKERRRRGAGPRVGFNFIVLVNTTPDVLRVLDLIAEINDAVGEQAVDFLTLREDFSNREGDGLTMDERQRLVDIFEAFKQQQRRACPRLSVDYGYALYPLSEGLASTGLAMVGHDRMLPKAYPQVSVALDLLGDVYLYRDAAFPNRPGADRYKIGTIAPNRSLEAIVREFIDRGSEIDPRPNDTWLMDAFDHVVTNVIWQARADAAAGIPFAAGPIARRAAGGGAAADQERPRVVNYWQNLFGA